MTLSTSDLYLLNRKSTRHLAEFRNGWGSAPVAWDYLADRYIAERPVYAMSEDHLKRVWALAADERLTRDERFELMLTFDRAFVPLANLAEAGRACVAFAEASEPKSPHVVNHWRAIGARLVHLQGEHHGRHARGVVLSATSVSDCWSDPSADWLENAWPIIGKGGEIA